MSYSPAKGRINMNSPLQQDPHSAPWNVAVRQIFQEQYALMVRKHSDYGPGNINAFGELGVLVRISDKLERLKNLLISREENGNIIINAEHPTNESVEDSYRDLLNYALIALMLRQGQWELPFSPDDTTL